MKLKVFFSVVFSKVKFSEEKLDANLEKLLSKVRRDVKVASRSVPADYNRDGKINSVFNLN